MRSLAFVLAWFLVGVVLTFWGSDACVRTSPAAWVHCPSVGALTR